MLKLSCLNNFICILHNRNQEIKVGSKLQKARLANGYTQEQVAEIIGCSSR